MFAQHFIQCAGAGRMTVPDYNTCFFCLFGGSIQHLVRNRFRKNNNHIRTSNLVLEIRRALREHLAFTSVFFTYFFIFAVHAVMTADDYNTHCDASPFLPTNSLHFFLINDMINRIPTLTASAMIL